MSSLIIILELALNSYPKLLFKAVDPRPLPATLSGIYGGYTWAKLLLSDLSCCFQGEVGIEEKKNKDLALEKKRGRNQ